MNNKHLNFTQDDVRMHKEFDESVAKLASWAGNTKDIAQLYRGLVWFAQLRAKIEANIIEVKAIKENYKPESMTSEE